MKLYRVEYFLSADDNESQGFAWFSSRAIAERTAGTKKTKPLAVEFSPTKAGILALLNQYASHPDNG